MKLKFWKTKREGSRRIDMYRLSRIVSQFAKSLSIDTAIMNLEFRPLAIDIIECLLLGNIKQVTDLIPVSFSMKRIGVLIFFPR